MKICEGPGPSTAAGRRQSRLARAPCMIPRSVTEDEGGHPRFHGAQLCKLECKLELLEVIPLNLEMLREVKSCGKLASGSHQIKSGRSGQEVKMVA